MASSAAAIAVLALFLSSSEFALVKQDGVPGRRIGGGTRYEAPESTRIAIWLVPNSVK